MIKNNDTGFTQKALDQIQQPDYLGDTQVVDTLVGQFIQELADDLANLDPALTNEIHVQRHLGICRRYAEIWAGKNKDYQPQPFHGNPAFLRYLEQIGIKAGTTEDAVYCLFGMLLKELYTLTQQSASKKVNSNDVKWQLDALMEFYGSALLGLDLSDYLED